MVCTFFNKTVNGKAYLSLSGSGREVVWGGSGRLFEAGRLLTFSAFRMGAYSRWALIRGWAPIRINTVCWKKSSREMFFSLTFFVVIVYFFQPVSLMFLLSKLFSSRMVLAPLNSWYLISVDDSGSSE